MAISVSIGNVEAISANAPAVIASGSASPRPDKWIWQWGDGEESEGASLASPPMHIYKRSGSYTIKLIAERTRNRIKDKGSATREVTVEAPADEEKRTALYYNDICRGDQFLYYRGKKVYFDNKPVTYRGYRL